MLGEHYRLLERKDPEIQEEWAEQHQNNEEPEEAATGTSSVEQSMNLEPANRVRRR